MLFLGYNSHYISVRIGTLLVPVDVGVINWIAPLPSHSSLPTPNRRTRGMLDVVLYGYDRRGRFHLREQDFFSLRGLAHFFASSRSAAWEWAEVTTVRSDGVSRVVRYSREDLMAIIEGPCSDPVPN